MHPPLAAANRPRRDGVRAAWLAVCFSIFPWALAAAEQQLPQALRPEFEAGVKAEKLGNLDEAEEHFQAILQRGGDFSFVHNNLGIVYQRRGEQERAIAQFRKAIRLQPDYLAPRVLLGSSLLATGKVAEAVRELERAVKLDPGQPLARLQMAKAYERANDLASMMQQYQALRNLAPRDPEYAYQMGQGYLKVAQWCFQQMKRVDPQSARVYEVEAEAYRAQGDVDMAVRALRHAAHAQPDLPGVHLALAEIFLQQRKTEPARREIEQELAIVPESVVARKLQARIASTAAAP
jgi:tetratricopeptide (TPR) repeat protein